MAVGAFKLFTRSKRAIMNGSLVLGAGVFKAVLLRASASAQILKVSNAGVSVFASIPGEISATGGYVAGGRNLVPATGKLTVGASARAMKFTYSTVGLVFTANGGPLTNIKYLLIRNSTGAGAGRALCYCTLSTAAFTIATGNSLTITPNATGGIFALS